MARIISAKYSLFTLESLRAERIWAGGRANGRTRARSQWIQTVPIIHPHTSLLVVYRFRSVSIIGKGSDVPVSPEKQSPDARRRGGGSPDKVTDAPLAARPFCRLTSGRSVAQTAPSVDREPIQKIRHITPHCHATDVPAFAQTSPHHKGAQAD